MQEIPPRRRITPLLALSRILLLTSLVACSDSGGGNLQEPSSITTVTLSAPVTEINAGQRVQVTATAQDASGNVVEVPTFAWASADESVATVSPSGVVTGVAAGQAEIRATVDGVSGGLVITVAAAPPTGSGAPVLQEVTAGLNFPVTLASPPNDERLFIAEKGGAIRIIKGGSLLPTPFLDISSKVSTRREQGLLGLAFPPDFASSRRFFVYYTDLAGDSRISVFQVSADPDRADPASETVVLGVDQPGPSHNGGQILFGPDGFLYIGLGDGGSHDGLDEGRGQSLNDLLSSVLRIDVSSGSSYSIPPDNPFVGTPGARPEIWSYGFRNPWRFSFDRATGDIYIADVGESDWEEVNYSSAADGASRGADYGWSVMEGTHCFRDQPCDKTGLTLPILEYNHSDGCAIIGGYVYRGTAIPALQGHYFYADLCQDWVRSFRVQEGAPVEEADWPALSPGVGITSFGEDVAGELYILTIDGRVLKIVPA